MQFSVRIAQRLYNLTLCKKTYNEHVFLLYDHTIKFIFTHLCGGSSGDIGLDKVVLHEALQVKVGQLVA
jgi:hypothetical protein